MGNDRAPIIIIIKIIIPLVISCLVEADGDGAGVGVEVLDGAEGLDVAANAMERALRVLHDAGAAEELVDGQAGKRLGRAAGGSTWLGPAMKSPAATGV